MIPREILKKVRRLEITTRSVVNEVFSGEYHSVFKGRGINFAEVREYQFGDDVRSIDWNVTARVGSPYVKVHEEERELTVMLVVDVSASGDFGTRERMKGEIAAELCALLAFSAIKNNDKVGLVIFSDRIEKFVPPRKGRRHVLRVLRELLYFEPEGRRTNVALALEYVTHVLKRRAVVFLVSDFLTLDCERALSVTGRRHDVIAVHVADRRETEIPPIGYVELEDAESGDHLLVNTSDRVFQRALQAHTGRLADNRRQLFRKARVDVIDVETGEPYFDALMRFFRQRVRRFR
jgi:uncharacterized protein (DUF58 family)